jgi:hypothetical protein
MKKIFFEKKFIFVNFISIFVIFSKKKRIFLFMKYFFLNEKFFFLLLFFFFLKFFFFPDKEALSELNGMLNDSFLTAAEKKEIVEQIHSVKVEKKKNIFQNKKKKKF